MYFLCFICFLFINFEKITALTCILSFTILSRHCKSSEKWNALGLAITSIVDAENMRNRVDAEENKF